MYATDLLRYDCVTCTAQQKVTRGCEVESPDGYEVQIGGEVHKRCPRRPILEDPGHYQELFWLYRQKALGYLPEDGGIDDQPAYLVQAFRIMDATLSRIEAHRRDEDERKRRRAARRGNVPTRGRGRR